MASPMTPAPITRTCIAFAFVLFVVALRARVE